MRYAIITTVDVPATQFAPDIPRNTVINIIELDDIAQWTAPANTQVAQSDALNIGDVYQA